MASNCPSCDRSFESSRGLRSHHAQAHGEKLRNWVECDWCGSDTENTPPKDSDKNFCDRSCYAQWQSENETGENAAGWKGGKVDLVCDQCGNDYKRKPAEADESRFCSKECHNAWMSENNNGIDHPCAKDSTFECSWCGDVQHRAPANLSPGENFCDKTCYGQWISENRNQENHPLFTGGRANYGKGWNDEKKERVRERDGHECQDCGMSSEAHKQSYGRDLSVHHIQKARNAGSDEERNAMENLVTLCMGCHAKWEKVSPLKFQT